MKEMDEIKQQLNHAYMEDWQGSIDDPAYLIQDIAVRMLEETRHTMMKLMEYHKYQFFRQFTYHRKYAQPFTTQLKFHPSPAFEGLSLHTSDIFYIQGESLLPVALKEDITLQHTAVKEVYSYQPQTKKLMNYQGIKNVPMFLYEEKGVQKFALKIVFPNLCKHMKNGVLYIYVQGETSSQTKQLLTYLSSSALTWHVFYDDKELEHCICRKADDCLLFDMPFYFPIQDASITLYGEVKYYERLPQLQLVSLYAKLASRQITPTHVIVHDVEEKVHAFPLCDSPISLFQACYIDSGECGGRAGAMLTWSFSLSEKVVKQGEELIEQQDYHMFMRKLPKQQIIYDVFPDVVQMEYFNGEWMKLNDVSFPRDFFKQAQDSVQLNFHCPDDMQPFALQGMYSYWFRLVVTKAENCYQIPSCHHIPIFSYSVFSYTYEDKKFYPTSVEVMANAAITQKEQGKPIPLFQCMDVDKETMYLLLNQKPYHNPLRMYVELQRSYDMQNRISYTTYTNQWEERLQVEDESEGFAHSGLLSFFFPKHMSEQTLFGQTGYWIKLQKESACMFNRIKDVHMNCVSAIHPSMETQKTTLNMAQLPITISCEGDVEQVLVNDIEWNVIQNGIPSSNEVLYDEEQKEITFYTSSFFRVPLKDTNPVVQITYHTLLEGQTVEKDTPVFPAQNNMKISSVKMLGSSMWNNSKESDEHMIRRLSHEHAHHQRAFTLRDVKQLIEDEFIEIHDVKCIQVHERMMISVLWKNRKEHMQVDVEKNTSVHQFITSKMAFPMKIEVHAPVYIYTDITFLIEEDDLDLDRAIQDFCRNYLDPIHGKEDGNGWRIGEYPQPQELRIACMYEFPSTSFLTCELKGTLYQHQEIVKRPFSHFSTIPNGLCIISSIVIERVGDEV